MLGPDLIIDNIQTGKKLFANTFIIDPVCNKAAHNYIDSQAAFARMLTKNTLDVTQYYFGSATKYLYPETTKTVVKDEVKKEAKVRKASKAKVAETTDTNTQGE